MIGIRDSISKKLTALNMLASGTAVLFTCVAFLAYDLNSLRQNLLNDLSIQAQIIGYNSVSALIFDDQQSAEKTLSALQASSHIIYAGISGPTANFLTLTGATAKIESSICRFLCPAKCQIPGSEKGNLRWSARLFSTVTNRHRIYPLRRPGVGRPSSRTI